MKACKYFYLIKKVNSLPHIWNKTKFENILKQASFSKSEKKKLSVLKILQNSLKESELEMLGMSSF